MRKLRRKREEKKLYDTGRTLPRERRYAKLTELCGAMARDVPSATHHWHGLAYEACWVAADALTWITRHTAEEIDHRGGLRVAQVRMGRVVFDAARARRRRCEHLATRIRDVTPISFPEVCFAWDAQALLDHGLITRVQKKESPTDALVGVATEVRRAQRIT